MLIRDLEVLDVDTGQSVGIGPIGDTGGAVGPLELARVFGDSFSVYSSDPGRPYVVDLRLEVGLRRTALDPPLVACALTAGALLAAATITRDKDFVDTLAVLVVPTTFAATATLIREETTLAATLQRKPNIALGVAIISLWFVAAARLAGVDIDYGELLRLLKP